MGKVDIKQAISIKCDECDERGSSRVLRESMRRGPNLANWVKEGVAEKVTVQ